MENVHFLFHSALEVLSRDLSALQAGGHKNYTSTACPGNMFPLYEMVLGKKRGEEIIVIENAEQALDKIIEKGVSIDKAHWLTACNYVKWLDELLIKIANKM